MVVYPAKDNITSDPQNAGLGNLPMVQADHLMRFCIAKITGKITYTKRRKMWQEDDIARHQAITTGQNRKSKD